MPPTRVPVTNQRPSGFQPASEPGTTGDWDTASTLSGVRYGSASVWSTSWHSAIGSTSVGASGVTWLSPHATSTANASARFTVGASHSLHQAGEAIPMRSGLLVRAGTLESCNSPGELCRALHDS